MEGREDEEPMLTEEKKPGRRGAHCYAHVKTTHAQSSDANFTKTRELKRHIQKKKKTHS